MFEFVSQNTGNITLLVTIGAGLFGFIKWLDSRNQRLRNERYEQYMRLIESISGGGVGITRQIASIWLLLEYKEYDHITLKVLDNPTLRKSGGEYVQELIFPQINALVQEIKGRA